MLVVVVVVVVGWEMGGWVGIGWAEMAIHNII